MLDKNNKQPQTLFQLYGISLRRFIISMNYTSLHSFILIFLYKILHFYIIYNKIKNINQRKIKKNKFIYHKM